MKRFIITSGLLVYYLFLSAQINEQYLKWQHGPELKVGDRMPDIPLGNVINNHTGKNRFSDFKGKLVILDFWNVHCSECLALMPHMEELQREFGEKIQVFIVNTQESQAYIEQQLKLPYLRKFHLPNLPSIVDARKLRTLFLTAEGVPHHVWIDGDGIVRIRGNALNTYSEKIKNLLAGKNIHYTNDLNSSYPFQEKKPYYKILNRSSIEFGSFFTKYNNNYAAFTGRKKENICDSSKSTWRSTYINQEVFQLYNTVYRKQIEDNLKKTIYSDNCFNNGVLDSYLFFVRDTLKYTFGFVQSRANYRIGGENTDENYIRSRFCYEQITPLNLSEDVRKEYMLNDLNRYFENLYNVKVRLEKRKISCYILIQNQIGNTLNSIGLFHADSIFNKDGKRLIKHFNSPLKEAVKFALIDLFKQNIKGKSLFIFDETGLNENVDIVLPDPGELGDIEDLRNALKPYGLDVIQAEREINMVVIREKGVDK